MQKTLYGYVRVSTKEQNEDRQMIALKEFFVPAECIYMDKLSGKDFNRPQYRKLLRRLRPGSTLVVKSIDRLGRNYEDILEQWRIITKEKKADIDLKAIEAPSWIEQDFIRKNIYSRPAVSLEEVNGIVIHYVANPGTTAKNNRDYFDSLADQTGDGTSVSSHFIVVLEGEIVLAVPISEMAYATKGRNDDTISIESCHPDDTGQYEQATYDSMVKLTAWLCRELNLDPKKDVIRHYDEGGKVCPKYFVENEDAWKQFLEDVKNAM